MRRAPRHCPLPSKRPAAQPAVRSVSLTSASLPEQVKWLQARMEKFLIEAVQLEEDIFLYEAEVPCLEPDTSREMKGLFEPRLDNLAERLLKATDEKFKLKRQVEELSLELLNGKHKAKHGKKP